MSTSDLLSQAIQLVRSALSGADPSQVVITDATGALSSLPLTSAQVVAGNPTPGQPPVAKTVQVTGSGLTVVFTAGAITFSLTVPVSIANGGTNSSAALANGKLMQSTGGAIVEGPSSTSPAFAGASFSGLTASALVATDGSKNLTSAISALSPAFTGLNLSGLAVSSLVATDGSSNLTTTISSLSPTLTGLTLSGLTASTLVATTAGKTLTSSVSTLSPGFTGLNLSGLTASTLVATDGSKNLTSATSSLSPTFTGLNLSGLSASSLVATDGSSNLTSTVSGLSPTLTGLTLSGLSATALVATTAGKALTSTVSTLSPSFAALTLSNTTNQLVLGGANTSTISATAPAVSQIVTLGDAKTSLGGTTFNFAVSASTNPFITAPVSFMPVVSDSSGHNFTMSNQMGWYVRSGDLIHFQCYVTWTAKPGGVVSTDAVRIGGLPIPSVGLSGNYRASPTIGYNQNITFGTNMLIALLGDNVGYVSLYNCASGSTATQVLVSGFGSTGDISLSGTYRWA